MRTILPLCLTALLLLPPLAEAGPPIPSQNELREGLAPAPAATHKSLTRGWPGGGNRGVTVEGEENPSPPSIQLQQISFEYNSAQLTTDARLTLDNLGAVLQEPSFKSSRFRLTGHTDAIGGEAFNQNLSERRAQSAKDYLVRRHHIDESRLETEGKGFAELADKAHPDNAVNRRVQVTNLGQ